MKNERTLSVSGQFYPDNADEVKRYIKHFNDVLDQNSILVDGSIKPRAIIVPHAGYIFSGFTANLAYRYIPQDVKNIIVIGPSHKFSFPGASVSMYEKYPTPFGELDINTILGKKIIDSYDYIGFNDDVHCEHSTEVQFPFIKYYCEEKQVIELIYSDIYYSNVAKVIKELLDDRDNFVVISTDLSHFYDIKKANELDNICLQAIDEIDIEKLDSGCEACGKIGVKAILNVAKQMNLNTKLLDYRTSADTSNDQNRVVGYTSALIY